MKNVLVISLVVTAGYLFAPPSAQGHHGWAEFDSKIELTFKGTVTDFHFVNPHCVVEFDAKDEKGQVRKWQGEFSNTGQLAPKGWTAASLKAGDEITVSGHPAKNGAPAMHVTRIRLSSGQELQLYNGR